MAVAQKGSEVMRLTALLLACALLACAQAPDTVPSAPCVQLVGSPDWFAILGADYLQRTGGSLTVGARVACNSYGTVTYTQFKRGAYMSVFPMQHVAQHGLLGLWVLGGLDIPTSSQVRAGLDFGAFASLRMSRNWFATFGLKINVALAAASGPAGTAAQPWGFGSPAGYSWGGK